MKSAVIFDMDGTVIDSMGIYKNVRYDVIKDMGYNFSEEELKELEGVSHWEFPRVINDKFDGDLNESDFFHIVNTRVREHYRNGFPYKKGFLRFIDYLDENNIKYCIATASKNINAISAFQKLGILDRFEFIITTNDVDRGKEFSTIYKEAAIMMKTHIKHTYVFEDALYAVKSAKSVGFKVVGIADDSFAKYRSEIIDTADYFIEDYDHLMDLIENKEIIFD